MHYSSGEPPRSDARFCGVSRATSTGGCRCEIQRAPHRPRHSDPRGHHRLGDHTRAGGGIDDRDRSPDRVRDQPPTRVTPPAPDSTAPADRPRRSTRPLGSVRAPAARRRPAASRWHHRLTTADDPFGETGYARVEQSGGIPALTPDELELGECHYEGPQANAVRVWRSGIGVDAHGNLIYAAADDQTAQSLVQILQRAARGASDGARHQLRVDHVQLLRNLCRGRARQAARLT